MELKDARAIIQKIVGKYRLSFVVGSNLDKLVDGLMNNTIEELQLKRLYGFCKVDIYKTADRYVEAITGSMDIEDMIATLESRARRGC